MKKIFTVLDTRIKAIVFKYGKYSNQKSVQMNLFFFIIFVFDLYNQNIIYSLGDDSLISVVLLCVCVCIYIYTHTYIYIYIFAHLSVVLQ